MIEPVPFTSLGAISIFRFLDLNDLTEAQLIRGVQADHLDLFADWRAMQGGAILSLVLKDKRRGGKPFAVLALGNTGQAGVAQAALLARNHKQFRRALITAARRIRDEMPEFSANLGIHRIEARCWADHPTAAGFLKACGFHHDADLRGFGHDGRAVFRQFAWVSQHEEGS